MPSPPESSPLPQRLVVIRDDIRQRLRDVNRDMPVEEFEVLVLKMARLQYEYECRPR